MNEMASSFDRSNYLDEMIIPIVIPAYEPEKSFIEFTKSLIKNIDQRIIVIDDGSGRQYEWIFDKLSTMKEITVLKHAVNLGKGRSLKDAFNYVLNTFPLALGVVTADSDGQHKVEDIKRVIDALKNNSNSLILGSRVFSGEGVPWKSLMGNTITSKVFRYLCGINLSDTQTGLRGIPRRLMEESLTVEGERFDYETNMLLNSYGKYEFVEVPIETVYESKTNHRTHFDPLRDSLRIYRLIFSYSLSSLLSVIIDFSAFSVMTNSGMEIWLATALGRLASTITNFTINRKIVFKAEDSICRRLIRYLLLVCVSGTISALAVSALDRIFGGKTVILKAIVEALLFFFNFFVQRSFVFSKKRADKKSNTDRSDALR